MSLARLRAERTAARREARQLRRKVAAIATLLEDAVGCHGPPDKGSLTDDIGRILDGKRPR
jgi:hypothetical protein